MLFPHIRPVAGRTSAVLFASLVQANLKSFRIFPLYFTAQRLFHVFTIKKNEKKSFSYSL